MNSIASKKALTTYMHEEIVWIKTSDEEVVKKYGEEALVYKEPD